ncbi:MAG: DUF4468 domain-containing protein [Bacteroidales bacterium]|nr:DUF4468 domain-containing protein [Bacteroidales bacterium]
MIKNNETKSLKLSALVRTVKCWLPLLMLAMPMLVSAASKDDSKYLAGAVPERNGIVTFTQTFSVKDKTQAEIYPVMQAYVKGLVAAGRQDLRTRIISDEDNTIVANVEEIMTFKKKFLNWDHTYFRYYISAECTPDAKVKMTITKISYYYGFDQEGNNGETFKAEEWISDKEALNKAGTKLLPRSGKFRRKTVDRAEEIFAGARSAFDTPVPQPQQPVMQNNTVVE